jgi:cytochrome c oxidase assembly protein subunit 15
MKNKLAPAPWFVTVSFLLVLAIFCLISLGGLVRNAGAGLACPDWPLCFGKVMPPMDVRIFLEWFHRLIAGFISIFVLALSIYTYMNPHLRSRIGKYCAWALALLSFQVVLGGMTVIGLLGPKWVTSHLAVGLAFYGVLLVLFMEVFLWAKEPFVLNRRLRRWAGAAVLAVYGQAILGGLVSSNYAGLACPDFPTCNGQWWPALDGLIKFQMLHRLGAYTVTLIVVAAFAVIYKQRNELTFSDAGWSALWLMPIILVVQVALGIGSVLWQLPLPLSVAHLASAAILLGSTIVVYYELGRR